MQKKKYLIYVFILAVGLATIISFVTEAIIGIITGCFIALLGSYIIYKEKIGQEIIVAFLFALALTAYYNYEYKTINLYIGKINLFPLLTWTCGFVALREIYENIPKEKRFLNSVLIYIFILFCLEYFGYYLLGIKLNSNYPSIFGIGILHGPVLLQIIYLIIGPVYLTVTEYLKLKYV